MVSEFGPIGSLNRNARYEKGSRIRGPYPERGSRPTKPGEKSILPTVDNNVDWVEEDEEIIIEIDITQDDVDVRL